jgi:hypothetical protein
VELAKACWYNGICEKIRNEHGPTPCMGEYLNTHWRRESSTQDQSQHVHAPSKWWICIKCKRKHISVWSTFYERAQQSLTCQVFRPRSPRTIATHDLDQ